MSKKTFKRFENKYLLNEKQYKAIMSSIYLYMKADDYSKNGGCYTIYNVYYDTRENSIIRASISKPYFKEKLRIRCYEIPKSPNDTVFLELKKKIGGVVSKRRATMTLYEATKFITSRIKPQDTGYLDNQVINEIDSFLERYEVLPLVFISYDRQAFFGIKDNEFRLTFDYNINTRREHISLKPTKENKPLLCDNQYLMEIKISGAIPLWLTEILSEHKIYSTSFSKYGTEYKQYTEQLRKKQKENKYLSAYLNIPQIAYLDYYTKDKEVS